MFTMLNSNPEYQNVEMEKDTGIYAPTSLGPRSYIADVYAEKIINNADGTITIQKLAIEIDGKYHKSSKDKLRDQRLRENGILTVRFPTSWVYGRKKLDDETLLKQIDWIIKNNDCKL